jgi:hypothetical protein
MNVTDPSFFLKVESIENILRDDAFGDQFNLNNAKQVKGQSFLIRNLLCNELDENSEFENNASHYLLNLNDELDENRNDSFLKHNEKNSRQKDQNAEESVKSTTSNQDDLNKRNTINNSTDKLEITEEQIVYQTNLVNILEMKLNEQKLFLKNMLETKINQETLIKTETAKDNYVDGNKNQKSIKNNSPVEDEIIKRFLMLPEGLF